MTLRAKLTIWYAAVLFGSLTLCGALLYKEWVIDPRCDPVADSSEGIQEPLHDLAENLLYSALPAAILGLGGGWWLTRRALSPVAALTETAREVSESRLGLRLQRSGNGDELDRLTEVFNDMLERLAASFGRIREFTLHASHELKTPLTIIRAGLESSLGASGLSEEVRKRLQDSVGEIDRLTRIVDGLTLLTKAGASMVRLDKESLDLVGLVREAHEDGLVLSAARGVAVSAELPEQLRVAGDRNRLRQLLLNLMDNAVKYNRDGGTISMKLIRVGETAEIQITNTGRALPAEEIGKAFEPFFRGKHDSDPQPDGCGLGLAISSWIVTAHGGTIRMSASPAGETTVTVRLPTAEEQNPGT